ncbi:MAG: response regulator transcription factor [Propionibacteriaceae bacterium]|nr:response regulator transcription factor [Propionibacteriaceae bacterium]
MGDRQPPLASEREAQAVVIEDEQPLARLLAGYLERADFAVTTAYDGPSGLTAVLKADPEVVVLDLGLPGMDGIEVCRRIREFSDCFIVMLTARAEEGDTLLGLSVGADTYMTKPFSPRELVARIDALRRRAQLTTTNAGAAAEASPNAAETADQPLAWGALRLDVDGREVRFGDNPVDLTRTEFDILKVLVQAPARVFTRADMLHQVWGPGWVGDGHVIDVHIAHIRRKLSDVGARANLIRSVRGVGYRLGGATEA